MGHSAERGAPCGSCGATPTYVITLHGMPVPACLRHLNHWRTPAPDYTCPTRCVEVNHPGREHGDWLTGHVPAPPRTICGSTGLVYCKACCSLLYGDRKGRTAKADEPCEPVGMSLRDTRLTPPAEPGADRGGES